MNRLWKFSMPIGVRETATSAARWSAISLGFSLPISAALDNVLVVIFLLAFLASGKLRELVSDSRGNAVGTSVLALASVMLIGLLWSPTPAHALPESIVNALTFAILPLFLTTFKDDTARKQAISAFLIATTLVLLLSYLLWVGLLQHMSLLKGYPTYPVAFKYHITHSFLMAIAVLFFVLRAERSNARTKFIYYVMAALAAFNVLFMVPGRTGQIALATAAFFFAYNRYRWRGFISIATLSLIVAIITVLTPTSVMHKRTAIAWKEAQEFLSQGAARNDSSIGLRLEFYRNTLKMITHRPFFGTGTGGFGTGYSAEVERTTAVVPHHPHNAFLFIAAELGIVGLAILLALLLAQWTSTRHMPDELDRSASRAILLIFVVGGLVSAVFTDHTEALFFVWISGILWSAVNPHRLDTSQQPQS